MSVVQNPIIGRAKGKYSSTIFGKWKSKNIIRTKPISFNTSYVTPLVNQRKKFTACLALARQLTASLRMTFKKVAVDITQFNYFMSKNINLFDTVTDFVNISAAQSLVFSGGSLAHVAGAAAVAVPNTGASLSWDHTVDANSHALTEKVGAAVLNFSERKAYIMLDIALYTDDSATVDFPVVPDASALIFVFCHTDDFTNFQYVDTLYFV